MKVSFAVISWIPAIHGAKTTKNQIPLGYVLLDYFTTRPSQAKRTKGGLIFSGTCTMYSRYP